MTAENYESMKERLEILSGERETAKRLLDSAVDSLGFSVVVNEDFSRYALFEECARKVRTFIAFESLAFLVFSPDGLDFSLAYCDPPGEAPFFEGEIDPLIEDRTFAWAVDRNRPVIVTASAGERQLLLHSITTQNRSMGMFIGLLGEDESAILDLSFAFLTVVLSAVAGLLQNAELFSVIRELNSELTKKIERLEESEQSLAEAMRARDTFLANVSHEIRTPLNGILGMTSLLGDTSLDGRQKELLKILGDESSSLLRLINDLLDFSKMEAGKLSFENAPFDFMEFWEGIRDSFAPRARQKNLKFRMELKGEPPQTVCGDSLRIRQVFGNVVGNAIKFTSKGEVSVTGEVAPGADGQVILTVDVRDSGIGVSKEQAARLFQPFTQGDSSTTRKYGGTGLGLVISRRLLEGMGGSISIERTGGPGAHFRFSVPLTVLKGPVRVTEEGDEGGLPDFPGGYSVLVAEDNDTSRLVAVSMLKKLGVPSVDTARDGAEAIEKLSASRYDLVLMDIQMPVMDGIEAVTVIRDPSSAVLDHDVFVSAMTANILPADREKYITAGMTEYISKPVLMDELKALFARALGGEGARPRQEKASDAVFRRDLLLNRVGGDEEICAMALTMFVDDSKKLSEDLASLLEAGDYKGARMKGHTLKGAAANVEADEIRAAAAAIEAAAEKENGPEALAALKNLFEAWDRFAAASGEYLVKG